MTDSYSKLRHLYCKRGKNYYKLHQKFITNYGSSNFPKMFMIITVWCRQFDVWCLCVCSFYVLYITIEGVGRALSSACKTDRADFSDWMAFLQSYFMEEISPLLQNYLIICSICCTFLYTTLSCIRYVSVIFALFLQISAKIIFVFNIGFIGKNRKGKFAAAFSWLYLLKEKHFPRKRSLCGIIMRYVQHFCRSQQMQMSFSQRTLMDVNQ